MKSCLHKKLLKLVSAEVFLQVGFERGTEQALNLTTDLLAFYLETLVKRSSYLQSVTPRLIISHLIDMFYYNEEYQCEELYQFVEQQIQMKTIIKEYGDTESSLLHMLKILPEEINLKSAQRSSTNLTIEERNNPVKIVIEAPMEDFLCQFIEECSKETGNRVMTKHSFDISRVLEEQTKISGPSIPIEMIPDALHDQEPISHNFTNREIFHTTKGL